MGRPASVTKAQIYEAADQLAAQGLEPDFSQVFAILRSGTRPLINRVLAEWRDDRRDGNPQDIGEEILVPIHRALRMARAAGVKQSERELGAVRVDLAATTAELERESLIREAADAKCAALEVVIAGLTSELTGKDHEIEYLRSDRDKMSAQRDKALGDAAESAKALELCQADMISLQTRLEESHRDRAQVEKNLAAETARLSEMTAHRDGLSDRLGDFQERETGLTAQIRGLQALLPGRLALAVAEP